MACENDFSGEITNTLANHFVQMAIVRDDIYFRHTQKIIFFPLDVLWTIQLSANCVKYL